MPHTHFRMRTIMVAIAALADLTGVPRVLTLSRFSALGGDAGFQPPVRDSRADAGATAFWVSTLCR